MKDKSLEESLVAVINKIFATSSLLTKSQHFDIRHSSRVTEEVYLWLDVLKLVVEDWLDHKTHPTSETAKFARDIEKWAFSNNAELNMMAEAIYVGFRIEPDLFKRKLRDWLRLHRAPKRPLMPTKFLRLEMPLETYEQVDSLTFESLDIDTALCQSN